MTNRPTYSLESHSDTGRAEVMSTADDQHGLAKDELAHGTDELLVNGRHDEHVGVETSWRLTGRYRGVVAASGSG